MKRGIFILVFWTVILFVVLATPIGEARMPTFGICFKYWDKVYHLVLFVITGFVGVVGATFFSQFKIKVTFAFVFGLFLAVSTEFVQYLLPSRDMSLYDLLADVVGVCVALVLCALIHILCAFVHRQAGLRAFFRL